MDLKQGDGNVFYCDLDYNDRQKPTMDDKALMSASIVGDTEMQPLLQAELKEEINSNDNKDANKSKRSSHLKVPLIKVNSIASESMLELNDMEGANKFSYEQKSNNRDIKTHNTDITMQAGYSSTTTDKLNGINRLDLTQIPSSVTKHFTLPSPHTKRRQGLRKLSSMDLPISDQTVKNPTDRHKLINSGWTSHDVPEPEEKFHLNGHVRKMSLPNDLDDIPSFTKLKKKEQNSSHEGQEVNFSSIDVEENGRPISARRATEFRLRDQLFSFFQASDNKLAMKLFGSRNALLKEKNRQKKENNWIIHPCSNFRLYWDLLMLVFLVTNLVVLPVSIAFFYDDAGVHWIIFNITCDTMFILDIVINFRTGLIDEQSHGTIIMDSKEIAKKYMKSWFVIDFISSLPLDYVFLSLEGPSHSAGRALRILRLAKLLQLLRLLRISRLVRYVRLWQEYFSIASIVVKLFNLICIMVLLGHWSGCIQFFVPVVQGLPKDSWIIIDGIQDHPWFEQYSRALFKALSHMLCIGYGQYPPRNSTDTWLTIASMLAGATCYALFIGHATTLIQSFDTSSRQFRDHLQQVNEYMIYRKLPTDLRRRITDYYDHRYGGKRFDERAILNEVSDSLRNDVIHHNCRQLLRSVPFFVNAEPGFVADVITKLMFEMFQPGDTIIKCGTKGDRLFFIQEGLVEIVRDEDNKMITRLGDGSYFGEISLLSGGPRSATVIAASYCNLFSLSKENFNKILECYPVMKRTLQTIAAQRLAALGKDPGLVASRESLKEDLDGIQRVFQSHALASGTDDESEGSCIGSHRRADRENSQFLTAVKGFFTKDSEIFSQHRSISSIRRNSGDAGETSPIHHCKSALNHLVLVPKMNRRAKSSSNVPDLDFNQNSPSSTAEPRKKNTSEGSQSPKLRLSIRGDIRRPRCSSADTTAVGDEASNQLLPNIQITHSYSDSEATSPTKDDTVKWF